MKNKVKKSLKISLIFLSLLFILTVTAIGTVCAFAQNVTLNTDKLKNGESNIKTYDAYNNLLCADADYVTLQQCPENLRNAFVACEDKRFYTHNGLDYKRIVGAALYDIKSGSLKQGASTITCQLAKNTQLSAEKTLVRKIKEAKLAFEIEKKYTKDEILEMYLNIVYFGSGIYGVGNAALSYFGKQTQELSLAQCASLAAVAASPSKYSPLINNDNNNIRKNTVLRLMKEQNYISDKEYTLAIDESISPKPNKNISYCSSYCTEALRQACWLTDMTEAEIKQSGYSVYTYCIPEEQMMAYTANHGELVPQDKQGSTLASSYLICDPKTGGVIAYSANHGYSPFELKRQPGSLIKPFIYAAAMQSGKLLPASIIKDEPTIFGDYNPQAAGGVYRGSISAREALAYSSNVCAVKALEYTGVDYTAQILADFGLEINSEDRNYALALGGMTYGSTICELSGAYTSLANGGERRAVCFVREIRDEKGNTIYKNDETAYTTVDSEVCSYINDCLGACVEYGTAKKLNGFNALCAKTGTVEQNEGNSDCWCAAYNADRVYCAWLGNLSMKSENMTTATGGGACALIIRNGSAYVNGKPAPITAEKKALDLLSIKRDEVLRLATENCPDRYIIWDYARGITEYSDRFEKAYVEYQADVVGKTIKINFQALPECDYSVSLKSIKGQRELTHVYDKTGEVNITITGDFGFNQISVIPAVNGKQRIEGEAVNKTFFCLF